MTYHAIVGADVDGTITHWSEGAHRLFGHSAADAVGKNLNIIIPPHLREEHQRGYDKALADPRLEDVILDVPALRADGEVREYPVRLLVISDAFNVALGALAIFSSDGRTGIGLYD